MNRRPQWCIGFARTQAGEEVSRGGVILCSAWEVEDVLTYVQSECDGQFYVSA